MRHSRWTYGSGLILALVSLALMAQPAAAVDQPGWYKQFNSAKRFVVLDQFNFEAVRDLETGLVWEQSPNTGLRNWDQSRSHCPNKAVGGRKGWRLPSFDELASLVDPNNTGGNPDLPSGHPFTNVRSGDYWSATSDALDPTFAWFVGAGSGTVDLKIKSGAGATGFSWCVRGPMNADAY